MISVQCWQDEDIKCGFYQSYVRHSFIFGILLLYFLFQTSYEVVNFLYFSKKTTIDLSIKFHVVCPAASVCQLEVNWNISFATWKRKIFSGAVTPLLPPTRSDCWLTMAEEIKKSMLLLGLNENDKLEMRELRRMFKRRSIAMLPEKHPTVPNAHSKFEEIITAFVQVRSHNVVRTTMVDCHRLFI